MFFSLEAMKKSRSRQLLVVFIGTVHVFLWFSARMRVFYCIQTCCQLWKISYYMLIFQPHPPHIITNSWRPLHDLSHSTINGAHGFLRSNKCNGSLICSRKIRYCIAGFSCEDFNLAIWSICNIKIHSTFHQVEILVGKSL